MKVAFEIEGSYHSLILKTIEEIMINVFGKETFSKILLTLKRNYNLEWKEIPRRSKEFCLALQQILGSGSMIIEDLIVESLYDNLGVKLTRKKNSSFADYISELTKKISAQEF